MRVLIADDERIIADSLAMIMRTRQMDALAVYSGESVLELAEEWHPDVVICDIVMSGLNGFEVGLYLRRHLPDCKVVLFSGHVDTAELELKAGRDAGGFEIFQKPIHPRVLIDYVEAFARTARSA